MGWLGLVLGIAALVAALCPAPGMFVAMALGIRGLPSGERELQWWAILLTSVVGVPVLIGLNALEYTASGAVLGHRIPLRVAMPIAIYARAANLLPLPGSALVRMQGLKREGSSYGRAASATLATALFWLGGALMVGAVVLVPVRPWLALLFGPAKAVAAGLVPFIPAEILKVALGTAILAAEERSLASSKKGR